jgi:hypothetical protein
MDPLSRKVCEEWRYCENRENLTSDGMHLAIAIADTLIVMHLPFPVAAASVYVVKKQLLDRWCKCGEKGGSPALSPNLPTVTF